MATQTAAATVNCGKANPIRLEGSRDRSSMKGIFPAIPESSPAAPLYEPLLLSEEATLYSFTIIHPNPKTRLSPYVLAYADFPEQVRVFGRLEMPKDQKPRIGMRLRTVAASSADNASEGRGYLFIPAEGCAE